MIGEATNAVRKQWRGFHVSSHQEACSLVFGGLESLRKGLILYHELGLTTKEIYADLQAAGWDKSLRTLQSHQTELRKEGLLPSAAPRGIHAVCAETCAKPVENSTTQPLSSKGDRQRQRELQKVSIYVEFLSLVLLVFVDTRYGVNQLLCL